MTPRDIYRTQKHLAIVFTLIVFGIAVVMEVVYFSIKFVQFNQTDEHQFYHLVDNFQDTALKDPLFIPRFVAESFSSPKYIKKKGGEGWDTWGGGPFRFVDFLLFDTSWSLVSVNLRQEMTLDQIESLLLSPKMQWSDEGFYYAKIDLSQISWNFKSIIFLKRQSYDVNKYLEDVFFFLLLSIILSIGFYFVGLHFAGRALKPVEETLQDMTDFVHHASHELKTPLSVMSSNLQLIKLTKLYDADLVANSMSEIGKMDELIVALTNLSNITSTSQIQTLKLDDEIKHILEERELMIQKYGILVNFKVKKSFSIEANKEYFYILFTNLLKNALKYNLPENGKITIVLDKNFLKISNTSSGIDSADLSKIFERFYKCEKSRNTEWFGIWLALVKKIAEIYKWQIDVYSVLGQETSFEIRF